MIANTNPTTGVRYTVFALNKLNPDLANDLFYGHQAVDLSYKAALSELRDELESEADAIEDEVRIAIAEADPSLVGNEAWEERQIEAAYSRLGDEVDIPEELAP